MNLPTSLLKQRLLDGETVYIRHQTSKEATACLKRFSALSSDLDKEKGVKLSSLIIRGSHSKSDSLIFITETKLAS